MLLREDDHVLFYGDSITDGDRRVEKFNNSGLGRGYPALIGPILSARYPDLNLKFTNRGVSGNRVYDLEARLQADVMDLEPTVVSILIGINDTWRRYDSSRVSPVDEFEASYDRICRAVRDKLGARLVICEPFLLPIPDDRIAWREDLDPRIAAVRHVAVKHRACYVPLDGIFAAAACRREMGFWLPDGVHPSPAGHGLIAEYWIRAVAECCESVSPRRKQRKRKAKQ